MNEKERKFTHLRELEEELTILKTHIETCECDKRNMEKEIEELRKELGQ